jgi:hypothetical protein
LAEHERWLWWRCIPHDCVEWSYSHCYVHVLLRVSSYKRNLVEVGVDALSDDPIRSHERTGILSALR